MNNAQTWAALQQSAMVGVDRLPIVQALGAVVDASATAQVMQAAQRSADTPATQLLRASAVAAVFARAGWQPTAQPLPAGRLTATVTLPPAAADETRSAPADKRLLALMREVLEQGPPDLLASLLHMLGGAGQRLPHDLLVPALEQGRNSVELRHGLAPVLGERGRWLGTLNPQWSYAAGVEESADPDLVWQEGSVEQRVALLQRERQDDPAAARARLEASVKELSAKERLPMVQTLAIHLSLDDEPLLERLLSDRGKEVREAAAQLLSCLPGSAHSQRVMAWMRGMLEQDGNGEWAVEPPEEGRKEWERDGIVLQLLPYHKGGPKSWLLRQMVQLTPLCFWTQTLGKTPMELMAWSQRSDWVSTLRQGWYEALRYQFDVQWIDAAQKMLGRDMLTDTLIPALMARLPDAEREARWLAQFDCDKGQLVDAIEMLVNTMPNMQPLSPAVSQRLVDVLHEALGGKQVTDRWHGHQANRALLACARLLDVNELERFAQLWRKAPTLAEPAPSTPASASAIALTPEQQAKLERSRLRPWDDVQVHALLERFVNVRLTLHQAFPAPQA